MWAVECLLIHTYRKQCSIGTADLWERWTLLWILHEQFDIQFINNLSGIFHFQENVSFNKYVYVLYNTIIRKSWLFYPWAFCHFLSYDKRNYYPLSVLCLVCDIRLNVLIINLCTFIIVSFPGLKFSMCIANNYNNSSKYIPTQLSISVSQF